MATTNSNQPTAEMRDRVLVASCLRGDEEAWGEVWRRYGPLVKSVARRVGCSSDEARDVVQRVALVALQRLEALRDPDKLASWLAGTARFQALELIRGRRGGEELHPGMAVHDPDPESSIQLDRDLAVLRRSMFELDPRCRRLITRLDLDDPPASYRQIADEEGLAASSIGPIRRRCLSRLGKIIDRLSHRHPPAHLQGGE